jgi:hypothetical protein
VGDGVSRRLTFAATNQIGYRNQGNDQSHHCRREKDWRSASRRLAPSDERSPMMRGAVGVADREGNGVVSPVVVLSDLFCRGGPSVASSFLTSSLLFVSLEVLIEKAQRRQIALAGRRRPP